MHLCLIMRGGEIQTMIDPSLDKFCKDVKTENYEGSGGAPWCNGKVYTNDSSFLCIHREILDFVRWVQPTESEKHIRYLVVRTFRSAVSLLWPDSKTICHGSTATDTFLPNGDMDFSIVGAPEGSQEALLGELCNHLLNLQIVSRAKVIHAKCPIIKCVEKPFNFNVDISIDNINGILNIRRNISLMQKYKELYPLLMILKVFLCQEGLDEPYNGGISSNTLIHLIVYILQAAGDKEKGNLGKLLLSFFKVFGKEFNFFTTGISTRNGGVLFSRIKADRLQFKSPVTLCVEDPQVPGSFLGENAFNCPKFRNSCYNAFRNINSQRSNEQSILTRFLEYPKQLEYARNDLRKHYQSITGTLKDGIKLSITRRRDSGNRDRFYEKDRERDRNIRAYNRDRDYRSEKERGMSRSRSYEESNVKRYYRK
jgi:non-canonical poly(A) RNA polymerase PAPD5/7